MEKRIDTMANKTQITDTVSLPLVALRGIVIFPGAPAKLELNAMEDLSAIALAEEQDEESEHHTACVKSELK